jgi:hypothetical protein
MIGTTGALVLVIVNVVLAGALGVGAGGLVSLILWRRWGVKTIAKDFLLAVAVYILAGSVIMQIEIAHGVWRSDVALTTEIAVGCVVVSHLLMPAVQWIKQARHG